MVDNPQPEAGVDMTGSALPPRPARRRGRGPARRRPRGLRRQRRSSSAATSGGSTAAAGTPKKGGNFRLGVTGGGARDIIDGQSIITKPDQARLIASWETLLPTTTTTSPGARTGWPRRSTQDARPVDVRLRSGIEFHNGKTLSADDVIYSLQRILEPEGRAVRRAGLASIDPNKLKKMDATRCGCC